MLGVRQKIEDEDFMAADLLRCRPPLVRDLISSRAESSVQKEIAMASETAYTLDQFLADTRATINAKGVPSGLAEIRDHLEKLLRNPELLKKHLGDPVPYRERTTRSATIPRPTCTCWCTAVRKAARPCPTTTARAG